MRNKNFMHLCITYLFLSITYLQCNDISGLEQLAVSKITVTFYDNPATSRGITWYTSLAAKNSDLQVVEKHKTGAQRNDNRTVKTAGSVPDFGHALKFKGNCFVSTNSPQELVHQAEATQLKPGTDYYFRVGDAKLASWSDAGTFRTADLSDEPFPFTFIHLSDTQAGTEKEAILSAATLTKALDIVSEAQFVVHTGDMVEGFANELEWNWLLKYAQDCLLNTTIVPVAGNHDVREKSFIEHFDIKPALNCNTSSGAYYSFDYSNAHFIILNTNEYSADFANFSESQIAWLQDDISKAQKAGADWLIINIHNGPYTISLHASDYDIAGDNGVRTKLAPLLSGAGVDLVLQGHDHLYSRTRPLCNGTPCKIESVTQIHDGLAIEYALNPAGTVYLNPGTAGAKVYGKNKMLTADYWNLFAFAEESHAAVYGADTRYGLPRGIIQNFIKLTIDGNKLTAVVYEIDQRKNGAQPYIIDSFGIIKKKRLSKK
jgi:3',5'-cyclic AMP phosphodiesterase CpdA